MFCIDFETFCGYAISNSQMIRMNQIFAKEDLILKFFSGKEKKHTAESNDDLIERLLLENYNRYYHLAYSYVHNPDDASDIVQKRSLSGDQKQCFPKAAGICGDLDLPHHVK